MPLFDNSEIDMICHSGKAWSKMLVFNQYRLHAIRQLKNLAKRNCNYFEEKKRKYTTSGKRFFVRLISRTVNNLFRSIDR